MPLPKLDYPTTDIELKSVGRKVKFRPMLVREEKLLLIAKESQSDGDIFQAVKAVVTNCCMDRKLDIDSLPIFELEFIFLTLRMNSVGDEINLSYNDTEDKKDYNFKINLNDIKITYPKGEKLDGKIELSKDVGIVFKWPPSSLYDDKAFLEGGDVSDTFEEMLYGSIDKIYDADSVYPAKDTPREELETFVESIDSSAYRKIQEFFVNVPYMEYVIKYTNNAGTERSIVLRTLSDFFML